jgi:signal transduction histidine kinase
MMATPATTGTARMTQPVESPASATAGRTDVATGNVISLDAYLRETLPLDLVDLAQDVVAQLLTHGRLDNLDIHYHLPRKPVRVELPRRQFTQIVELMMATAADAMAMMPGQAHALRVIVEEADAFGDYGPRLRVQDTGASVIIEDALQAAIERAETLGAKLTVKNRPLGGNLFTVELPAEQPKSW